jgi:hypothetical protein
VTILKPALACAALTATLLSGCTPASTPTTPAQPSPTCTPEAGGPAYPCSPYYYEQMVAKDKLYAEAETVYRKFLAEEERIYRTGGIAEPTPALLETTTGQYLSDSMQIYRNLNKRGLRIVSGNPQVVWIQRVAGATTHGSVVAMKSCKDSSQVAMAAGEAKPTFGRVVAETAYFMKEDSGLKVGISSSEVVKSC